MGTISIFESITLDGAGGRPHGGRRLGLVVMSAGSAAEERPSRSLPTPGPGTSSGAAWSDFICDYTDPRQATATSGMHRGTQPDHQFVDLARRVAAASRTLSTRMDRDVSNWPGAGAPCPITRAGGADPLAPGARKAARPSRRSPRSTADRSTCLSLLPGGRRRMHWSPAERPVSSQSGRWPATQFSSRVRRER